MLKSALCLVLMTVMCPWTVRAEDAPTIASAGAAEPAATVKAPPPILAPVYAEPFPAPKQPGEPSQPAESIALYESFENVAAKTDGVLGAGWLPKNSDGLPLRYPLPEAFKKSITALSIEWWMKRELGGGAPNGTLIHGPGFKVSFGWNQSPHGTMHIKFEEAKQGAWIGHVGPEIPLSAADGHWHYYAATFDLHEVAVYIDGEIYSREWQGNNAEQIGPMCDGTNEVDRTAIELGGNAPGRWPDQAFTNVPIDEVRVSTVALNALQVRRNFENIHTPKTVLYVAPDAKDDGDGSPEHPLGLADAVAKATARTRMVLLPGTYAAADLKFNKAGASALEDVELLGKPGAEPAVLRGGVRLSGSGYVVLRNLSFESADRAALAVQNFDGHVALDACRLSATENALTINAAPGTVVENCIIAAAEGDGIDVSASPACVFKHNTIVGGARGLAFAKNSGNATLLNTLFSGQRRACLSVDESSLAQYRGDGNCYDPANGGVLAQLGEKSFSAKELDGFRRQLYRTDFPQDKDHKQTAYGPENHSTALPVKFVDAEHGHFALAPVAGNPIDAGTEYAAGVLPGLQRVEAALTDITGAVRDGRNAADPGAFEAAAPLQYRFKLEQDATTSAGIYRADGTLERTLWSGRPLRAGEQNAYWNGLNDAGENVADGEYTIKVAAHNLKYVWEGVIGNTSASFNGPTVHSAFLPVQAMCFAGSTGFYVAGYNEGGATQFRFDVRNPQVLTGKIGAPDFRRAFNLCATDGKWVYFVDTNPPGLVTAAAVQDGKPVNFSAGKQYGHWNGIELNIKNEGLLGLAVQADGELLFVAHRGENKIFVFDKRSGASRGAISVDNPGRIATDAKGALWVCCRVEGKGAVAKFTSFDAGAQPALVIHDLEAPAAVAVSPVDGTIVVADAEGSQQLKAYDPAGAPLWTYGQKGGYDNGPAVTTDKFFFKQTLLAFQPDGSFWVKDEATNRVLHFTADRRYIDCIMYQPHPFTQTTDPKNPARAFINWLEFAIDYSKPLTEPGAWKLVNYWGHKLPPVSYNGFDDGLYQVVTLKNGRTYGLVLGGEYSAKKVVELAEKGLRFTAAPLLEGKLHLEDDGALSWVERNQERASFMRRELAPFDETNDPRWEAPRMMAQAPVLWNRNTGGGPDWRGGAPVGDDMFFAQWRLLDGLAISYNGERYSSGWHLGAVRSGDTRWYWTAAPSGPMDGHGTFDTNVEYAGRALQVAGRHVFYNLHGEFWHGGQANQFFDYLDNGLFLGQFGQPNVFGVGGDGLQSRVPGAAGNSFAMTLVTVGERLYVYHNDENGHGGSQRWRVDGWRDIVEYSGSVRKGEN